MKRIVDVSLRSLCAVELECRTASICLSTHDDRFHRWTSEMLTFAWRFTQAPLRSNSIQLHVERYFSMPLQKKTTLMTGTRSGQITPPLNTSFASLAHQHSYGSGATILVTSTTYDDVSRLTAGSIRRLKVLPTNNDGGDCSKLKHNRKAHRRQNKLSTATYR